MNRRLVTTVVLLSALSASRLIVSTLNSFQLCVCSSCPPRREEAEARIHVRAEPKSLLPLPVAERIVAMAAEVLDKEDNLLELQAPITVCLCVCV